MKRLMCFGFVALSACASVPPGDDLALAEVMSAEIFKETGETCDLVRYQNEGRTDGNVFLASRNNVSQDQADGTAYTVQCRNSMTYGVLLPDDPHLRSWVYPCFDGNKSIRVGCNMFGPYSGTRHNKQSD